jgi:Undecaprenyl-phosphate glucose phosphotransferase
MSDHISALAPPSVDPRAAARVQYRLALPFHFVEPAVLAVDFVLLTCASVVAGVGYHWIFLGYVPYVSPYLAVGALAALNVTTTLAAVGGYKFQTLVTLKRQTLDVTLVWVGVFFALLGIAFTLKIGEALSRGATLGFFVIGLLFLSVWRVLVAHLLASTLANGTFAKRKTMLVADQTLISTSKVLGEIARYGYVPRVVFEINPEEYTATTSSANLPERLTSAIRVARQEAVDNILLLIRWEHSYCIESILLALSVLPIPVYLIPDEGIIRYLSRTHCIGPVWTAELKRAPLSKFEQLLKRTIDLIAAGLGLFLLSPLLMFVALSIKLDSNGPVLFTQWRSGFNGRLFRIFKFRTMSVLEDGPVIRQAARNDPRFTRLGRWLRRTNIDELPQLLNVLRGEMSLVGPRPHAAAHDCEYERQIAAYAFRYQLKPGITGWAQLNGYRGETRTLDLMSRRVEYDLWYIKNWSFWLDLKILLGTVVGEIWRPRGY